MPSCAQCMTLTCADPVPAPKDDNGPFVYTMPDAQMYPEAFKASLHAVNGLYATQEMRICGILSLVKVQRAQQPKHAPVQMKTPYQHTPPDHW